ncbi:MAG: PEGA domain-containing protein [Planctomycetota bacterium]|jgi:hypothetical protein
MKNSTQIGRVTAAGFLLSCLTGCATILNGTSQSVEVRSAPHGARVIVDGRDIGTTPLKADLKRGIPHTVQVSKDGYLDETLVTTTKGNGTTALNVVVFGGVAGVAVDMASGAATSVTPDAIAVDLVEEARPQASVRLTGHSNGQPTSSAAGRINLH